MADAFIWFHHSTETSSEAAAFYRDLLGWPSSEGPGGMTMFTAATGPFAATGLRYGDVSGWIPFVQVDDVRVATQQAVRLGAAIVKDTGPGPAGEFSVVRDPSGAAIGLWRKA